MAKRIAVLAGDGIGPEVTREAVKVLEAAGAGLEFCDALFGGCAYDAVGDPLPDDTLSLCREADAALMGAVGGPKWEGVQPLEKRPEIGGLLRLRGELELFANLRPAKTLKPLQQASPLRDGGAMDLMVVRELTGGIYFGKPRERRDDGNTAIDTLVYTRAEIERISLVAIEIARARDKRIVSVDKANVLESSRLWREVVDGLAAAHSDIAFSHMLVDNCAMQLVRDPGQFDVILTENMFGDILSDEAAMITGSLGLLPSASLGASEGSRKFGVYEPIHGSAPDIAGENKANPLAAILSGAMMLRHSLGDGGTAVRIEGAVEKALEDGLRTSDIEEDGCTLVGTREMGDAVASRV